VTSPCSGESKSIRKSLVPEAAATDHAKGSLLYLRLKTERTHDNAKHQWISNPMCSGWPWWHGHEEWCKWTETMRKNMRHLLQRPSIRPSHHRCRWACGTQRTRILEKEGIAIFIKAADSSQFRCIILTNWHSTKSRKKTGYGLID
jgi:tRNA threonylcarbamoyladenosine modification (KEOPS) complex  Pcc1 subunit